MDERVIELDYLKCIAIVLVVLGHLLNLANIGRDNAVVDFIFDYIYIFHMPLFFAVSGYLFQTSTSLLRKANRILVPFLIFGFPHSFIHILHKSWDENIWKNILLELVNVLKGGYYWYLIFLFYMMIVTKVISACFGHAMQKKTFYYCIFIVALVLYLLVSFLNGTELFVRFLFNYSFFVFGMLCKEENYVFSKLKTKVWFVGIFVISVLACGLFLYFEIAFFKWLGALGMIIICSYAVQQMKVGSRLNTWFAKIGQDTMPVYLMDSYLITIETYFFSGRILLIPFLCLVNIFGPVAFYEKMVKKNDFLKRVFGG